MWGDEDELKVLGCLQPPPYPVLKKWVSAAQGQSLVPHVASRNDPDKPGTGILEDAVTHGNAMAARNVIARRTPAPCAAIRALHVPLVKL